MQRRRLLALGIVSSLVLAVGGSAVALLQPGLRDGRLVLQARGILRAVASALLEGALPGDAPSRDRSLGQLLDRIDAVVAALPGHTQGELSQLLALLGSAAGRRAVMGLEPAWESATVPDVQAALQVMRHSRLALRRQVYQALHEIVNGAYFADAHTWPLLGYPGPREV